MLVNKHTMAGNIEDELLSEVDFKEKVHNTLQKKGILDSLKVRQSISLMAILYSINVYIPDIESVEMCYDKRTPIIPDHTPYN